MSKGSESSNSTASGLAEQPEVLVGKKIREIRTSKRLSLRALADRSGLNVNTLSLVENGKSSPSVSTLQQLALALDVPIGYFFATEPQEKKVVFTPASQRPQAAFGITQMQNLGKDLAGGVVQPFMITLSPGMGSGERKINHNGYEFVYCLSGTVHYEIDTEQYQLEPGDSLVFEADLPHCWQNKCAESAELLLVFCPHQGRAEPGRRGSSDELIRKEIYMKIAVITDDGKTISQHFGRAPYYQVLTIENGKITQRELRDKLGHGQFAHQEHAEDTHGAGHGRDAGSHSKHISMAEIIADCQVLLCGGMGMGAYESMRRLNIQPVVTDLRNIDEAVTAYVEGKLIDHTELLH